MIINISSSGSHSVGSRPPLTGALTAVSSSLLAALISARTASRFAFTRFTANLFLAACSSLSSTSSSTS
jgi:hypothetical protein